MNIVKCGVGECPSVFKSEEPLSPSVRYVCKLHDASEQRVFFQEYQFDKNMSYGAGPIGTTHIPYQADRKRPNGIPPTSAFVKKDENAQSTF